MKLRMGKRRTHEDREDEEHILWAYTLIELSTLCFCEHAHNVALLGM